MTTKNIADKLLASHIIKDKDPFYNYMNSNKLEKYVQLGKYTVTSKMSIPEIAKTITKNH
jgi:cell division protein YceG involved in septum cleavage